MDEVVLTEATCIPGTRVKPIKQLRGSKENYWEDKTEGTIVELWEEELVNRVYGARVLWDNYPEDDIHRIHFYSLVLVNSSIDDLLESLDELEQKLINTPS